MTCSGKFNYQLGINTKNYSKLIMFQIFFITAAATIFKNILEPPTAVATFLTYLSNLMLADYSEALTCLGITISRLKGEVSLGIFK